VVTESQIRTFCHDAWRHTSGGGQVGAPNIKDLAVAPKDGSSVLVSGLFYFNSSKEWLHRTFLVRMVNPNGSLDITSGNIVLERIAI
jgi:hypothetical protein